jgi:hypothetical protein
VDMDLLVLRSGHCESVSLLEEALVVLGGGCLDNGLFLATRVVTPTGVVFVLLAVVIGIPW